MVKNPDLPERRPYLYAVFSWCYTCLWAVALIASWKHYDQWPLWVKICASLGLIITTPAGSDLFLFLRRRPITK
jgi:hypothetical protein